METQEQSLLLSVPYEVRQAIYACLIPNEIHVFLRQGKIAISTCIVPDTAEYLDGEERQTNGDREHDTIWAHRLRSSWGPHWQCEEVAQRTAGYQGHQAGCDFDRGETAVALLFVCKRMHMDILNLMASTATFHVTDLETLDHLAQSHRSFGPFPSPYGLLHAMGSLLRKLTITLRLPLSFFEAVSRDATTSSPSGNTQMPDVSMATSHATDVHGRDQSSIWMRVWPALAVQLKHLHSLHLWLDHDDPSSWSFVDERAALSSFTASMSPDKIPGLEDISVDLPNLHPRYEKPERHFTKGSLQPLTYVTLNRRWRQSFYCEETIPGHIRVRYEADFPIMQEIIEFEKLERPDCEPMTREQLEDWERRLWESGVNVHDFFLSMCGGHSCDLVPI